MPSKKLYQLVDYNEKTIKLSISRNFCSIISCFVILTCSILTLFFLTLIPTDFFPSFRYLTSDVVSNANGIVDGFAAKSDGCEGRYIYVVDLPSEFNTDLVENCSVLNPYTDECKILSNSGLGRRLSFADDSVFSASNWFETDQFSLELIFHNRMKQYRCLTDNYAKSSAVFVPFYPSLDLKRNLFSLNATLRDETSINLARYISRKPEWKTFGGRDHFLIAGRTTWDFSRKTEDTSAPNGWGNKLLDLPEIKNMTSLLLESNPTSKSEIGIPYPTFFHPSSGNEVVNWQEKMRKKKRPYLFSFVGAPRPNMTGSIRDVIIKQCLASTGRHCEFLHVKEGVSAENIMNLFQSSDFCLQPPGDSLSRKSTFDSMLAGCIPVFFHPGSAYVHYIWHLPKNYSSYSVFIPMNKLKQGKVSIEKVLLEIPKEKIKAMREEVIKLIPSIVYANPNSNVDNLEDAFEVAVKGVLKRVEGIKREMEGGKVGSSENVPNFFAWKYNFFGNLDNNEWDKYFVF